MNSDGQRLLDPGSGEERRDIAPARSFALLDSHAERWTGRGGIGGVLIWMFSVTMVIRFEAFPGDSRVST